MGTATKLSNRIDVQVDDRHKNTGKKKENTLETAALGMNSDNANLLGFKTGFKVF